MKAVLLQASTIAAWEILGSIQPDATIGSMFMSISGTWTSDEHFVVLDKVTDIAFQPPEHDGSRGNICCCLAWLCRSISHVTIVETVTSEESTRCVTFISGIGGARKLAHLGYGATIPARTNMASVAAGRI